MGRCNQYLKAISEGCVIFWVLEKREDIQPPPHRGVDSSSDPESPAQSGLYGDLEYKRDLAKLADEMPADLPPELLGDLMVRLRKIRLGEWT
ncbi:hypothetical protein ISF_01720 [Cordyceps fumosorosea ARSEF 2679]|uniref:Uncharacterized protein n=1 Tax=Cordyceps fumosorosea (strain ARSEF 2679) TaxID=1081104 RepID=A0A162MVG4_CORFA|nr:hypothetical protein ISF_01720 [Cordyceps fumosorosea ARSEF 2679]OAA71169.1 hypothetical protein ISF_01720 [Cordyceps fumosorosea ARSEF 2679]